MAFRTENQIYADLVEVINGFLSANGYTDWQVCRSYQPSMQGIRDKVIQLTKVYSVRYGWQGNDDIPSDVQDKLIHIESQIMNESWQIDCIKMRNVNDTAETISGADMMVQLGMFFAGDAGRLALRTKGYSLGQRLTSVRNPYEMSDSKKYMFNPGFDIHFMYWQTIQSDIETMNILDGLPLGIYEV